MRAQGKDLNNPERRIYVGYNGQRYVKVEELLKDPIVQRRLKSAERLATKLGLKSELDK